MFKLVNSTNEHFYLLLIFDMYSCRSYKGKTILKMIIANYNAFLSDIKILNLSKKN